MNKTRIKYPCYHNDKLYKSIFGKHNNKRINVKNVSINLHMTPLRQKYILNILDAQNTIIKNHNICINSSCSDLIKLLNHDISLKDNSIYLENLTN